jgi:predicted nicotinamide N-methyase
MDFSEQVHHIAGGEIQVTEATSRSLRFSPPYGGRVWDSGFSVAAWLEAEGRGPELLRGQKVLELGSGAGMVGLCCAMLGADVTLTDGAESLMPLLDQNLELNADAVAERGKEPAIEP